MSDSERPNAQAPSFEVPDLELEPVTRPARPAAQERRPAAPPANPPQANTPDHWFGASFDFGDDLGEFELERSSQPNARIQSERARRSGVDARGAEIQAAQSEPSVNVPSGHAPDAAKLVFDPHEVAVLADYGEPPDNAALTPAYAYRVFTRRRELKQRLSPLAAECERAEHERSAALADFSRALRPALEQSLEFRRFLAPLAELEQRAAARGQALDSINAQLDSQHAELDAELARLASALELEQRSAKAAQQEFDEREANAKRAEAKLKRVQIEMRAVTQVAERKLDTRSGAVSEPEATELAALAERAQAMEPELTEARAHLEQARRARSEADSRVDALQRDERKLARKRQAIAGAYQKELASRAQGVSDIEIERRRALAELARAVLASPGKIALPEDWLERVRAASARADQLIVRRELLSRAIASYDVSRARQGVRLACTAVGLLLVLFVFRLIF